MSPVPAGVTGSHEAGRPPEAVDRMLVAVCGAIWLVLLVVAVVAAVALINLGRVDRGAEQSPWVLYTVIAVSGLTILGAIPLLLRARRDAVAAHQPAASQTAPQPPAPGVPAEQVRVFGTTVDPRSRRGGPAEPGTESVRAAAVHRVWLRGTVSMLGAMGLAWTAVAAATYLLAAGSTTAAIVGLGVAGAVVIGMPLVLLVFQRALAEAAG